MSPPYRWTYCRFRDITLSKLTTNELPVPTYISYIYDREKQIKQGDAEISYTYNYYNKSTSYFHASDI